MHPFLLHYPVLFSNVSAGGAPDWVLRGGTVPANLDIDFVNDRVYGASSAAISSVLSCSRGSGGYYLKADGTLQWFTNDTLRYGTNGLLVEEARTNLVLQSNTLSNASWLISSGSTATQDGTLSPDGTTQLWKLAPTAGSAIHEWYQQITVSSGTTHAVSAIVKPGGKNFVQLMSQKTTNRYFAAVFDLSNAGNTTASQTLVGSSSTLVSTSQKALSNGCFLITIVGSHTGAADPYFVINPAPAATGNTFSTSGDITWNSATSDTIYAGFCQAEVGSSATSHIPTTTLTATRSADSVTMAVPSYFNTSTGTFYNEITLNVNSGLQFGICADDGTSNNFIALCPTDTVNSRAFVTSGGVSQANISGTMLPVNGAGRQAMAWATNDIAHTFDGETVGTDASATIPTGLTTFRFGDRAVGSRSTNGYIRRVAYWTSRVSNANLQTLTA